MEGELLTRCFLRALTLVFVVTDELLLRAFVVPLEPSLIFRCLPGLLAKVSATLTVSIVSSTVESSGALVVLRALRVAVKARSLAFIYTRFLTVAGRRLERPLDDDEYFANCLPVLLAPVRALARIPLDEDLLPNFFL